MLRIDDMIELGQVNGSLAWLNGTDQKNECEWV